MNMGIFQKALEILDRQGWHQGSGVDSVTGAVCAGIAVALASDYFELCYYDAASGWQTRVRTFDKEQLAAVRLRHYVLEEFGEKDVFAWNDDPNTTEEDVRLAFKHLAALEEDDEA